MINVLIGCEYSGTMRDAFIARGHNAISCDLLPTDRPGPHYQGDVFDLIAMKPKGYFDLMISHPPCTHLAVSGSRHFAAKKASGVQDEALAFVQRLMDVDIPFGGLENPISIISSRIRKPDQIVQPWQFGHPEFKATCLWLKGGLPKLVHTNVLDVPEKNTPEWISWNKVHRMPPGDDRWKKRSTTYQGIADAAADQWGRYVAANFL